MRRLTVAWVVTIVAGCSSTAPLITDAAIPDADGPRRDATSLDAPPDRPADRPLIKKDSGGPVTLWSLSAGGEAQDAPLSLAVDPAGRVFVGGSFGGVAHFGARIVASNNVDLFVARLSAAGQVDWVVSAGGPGTDAAFGLTPDGKGG